MKKSKLKVSVGLILSAVMLFSIFVPVFAAGEKCGCGKTPVVSVTGINSVPLVDGNGNKVFPFDASTIVSSVLPAIPALVSFLANGDVNALLDEIIPIAKAIFDPIKYDENGYSVDPGVGIDRYFPESFDKYNYELNEGSQDKFSLALAKEIRGDHVYIYTYDWRRSPMDIADELNDYIQSVKEQTGHDKVAINGQSMGSCMVQAYLAKYGTKDVKTVAMFSGAYTGLEMVGQLFTGNIKIDGKGLVDIIVQAINGSPDKTVLGELLKYTTLFERVIDRLSPLLNGQGLERLYTEMLIPYFGYFPGMWSFVPNDYYNEAVEFMFKNVNVGPELMAKIAEYHTLVQLPMESRVKNLAADNNINYFCTSNYNRQIAPVTPSGSINSDGVIESVHTSAYGTFADRGTTLGDGYTQAVNCHDDHISPDNVVDASTCWTPEHTWIIKNMDHVVFTENGNAPFFVWLMTADKQYTVRSNPMYTQFMFFNTNADRLAPYLYEYGDVNLDGTINLVDARMAFRHMMAREELSELNLVRADVNVDGIVSQNEVRSIMTTYAGI